MMKIVMNTMAFYVGYDDGHDYDDDGYVCHAGERADEG